jgi:lipooligosaccharide transport system ATP-binding protein
MTESGPPRVIHAEGLTKRYGNRTAVDGVDVEVRQGEFWGLLGPNGAGKTTFLRMVIGAVGPSSGRLQVLGHPVPDQARRMRRRVGVVPQLDNLDPDFSVVENLRTYAGFFRLSGPALDAHIEGLLGFAALESKRDERISALSGGMQRRLSLVRALVNQPDLLVLDEPTTGLDPQARQLMWQRLRELKSRGITVVLTTHYMEEAQRLCDRITVMDHGRLLDSNSPAGLIARHIEPHVVEVYGDGAQTWHRSIGVGLADRSEQVGETWLYYTRDEEPLLDALKTQHEISYLHRPANLEDVFVKLTGRELREG